VQGLELSRVPIGDQEHVVTTGVTFAIVGGNRKYKKAHGTVTAKIVNSIAHFTFRVL
jgi:hypothetical protein